MRRSPVGLLWWVAWLVAVTHASAQGVTATNGCASTPEAAVESAMGRGLPIAPAEGEGFRVQDVQVDAVLHRTWARVRRCDRDAPLIFMPLKAAFKAVLPPGKSEYVAGVVMPVLSEVVVHAGDVVRVVSASDSVRMVLEATANQQGAVGDMVVVTLKRRMNQAADEPDHRMRGTVLADKSVEVKL
ncbi:hypothetical protein Terro_1848 [Terriglobus roseus DSM 18391]|uniref:Flagella basal body P-ring formation protein FlgA n=1 Tax=Terriglobus roseus (strain DSM 18391 / NRRL B-41598 / KBS 63) TaxID=926566 RepID=I3ZFX2_TERRK|nr:hypothetical protein [Terriglobus roseus]AFL88140.1 hypothetical protein Terro_1848 [Terriglobus roseus DSM 18391]